MAQADVILGKVGEIEDLIFLKRKECEDEIERKKEMYKNNNNNNNRNAIAKLQSQQQNNIASTAVNISKEAANKEAAIRIKQKMIGTKRNRNDIDVDIKLDDIDEENFEENVCFDDDIDERIEEPIVLNVVKAKKVLTSAQLEATKEELKKRIKEKEQQMFDQYKLTVDDNIKLHETGWKDRYYNEKHKKENIERGGGIQRMCYTYVQGLCWVLKYYYEGVPSWNWYYPFHYAPFASDLVNIENYGKIEFELAEPFRPVEQLLAVLPSNSVHALPEACRWLMTDQSSPIIDLYNDDVPIDPNGKHLPWLWILLLPFVDEKRITAAFDICKKSLTLEERQRNAYGCSVIFLHRNNSLAQDIIKNMNYKCGQETDESVKELLHQTDFELDTLETEQDFPIFPFNAALGNGSSGFVTLAPPKWFSPIDTLITSPCDKNDMRAFHNVIIPSNQVLTFQYLLPSHDYHRSELLPRVVHKESVLTQFDLIPKRPPRLNKGGFSILDMLNNQKNSRNFQSGGSYNNSNYNYHTYANNNYGNQMPVSYPNTGMPSIQHSFFYNNQLTNQSRPSNNMAYPSNNNHNNNYSNNHNNYSNNHNNYGSNNNYNNNNYQNNFSNRDYGNYHNQGQYNNYDNRRSDNRDYSGNNRNFNPPLPQQPYQNNSYDNNPNRYNNNTIAFSHRDQPTILSYHNNNTHIEHRQPVYNNQKQSRAVYNESTSTTNRNTRGPPPIPNGSAPAHPYQYNINHSNLNYQNNINNNQNQSSMQSMRDQLIQTLTGAKKK